jgi:hypothetical protein
MCANAINLFTVLTILLFAHRLFYPEAGLNWLTVFTPYLLGEGLWQFCNYYVYRAHRKRADDLAAVFGEMAKAKADSKTPGDQ